MCSYVMKWTEMTSQGIKWTEMCSHVLKRTEITSQIESQPDQVFIIVLYYESNGHLRQEGGGAMGPSPSYIHKIDRIEALWTLLVRKRIKEIEKMSPPEQKCVQHRNSFTWTNMNIIFCFCFFCGLRLFSFFVYTVLYFCWECCFQNTRNWHLTVSLLLAA